MNFNTRVCQQLGIKYPIFQGGMAWIAGGRLAAAVSEAGGCGFIGTGGADPSWLTEQLTIARQYTNKPLGVNLMLTSPYVEQMVDLIIAQRVEVVSTGAGNPGRFMERFKAAGITVIPVVSSVSLGRRLERLGADAIVAEGMESGGHMGEMTTMCLVPMLVDAVQVPVVAAGGIADGRGMVAAMALGAEGIQMGTVFVCSEECLVHPNYKARVIKAGDRDTVMCGLTTAHPVRALHNRFTREYLTAERDGTSKEVLEGMGIGRYPKAAIEGDVDYGTVMAGQVCGLVNKIEPASEIVERVMQEAKAILNGWGCTSHA
ncbi:MAG: nitronate monooxygenase [Methylocystaceae bacterium]